METGSIVDTAAQADEESSARCKNCGGERIQAADVKSAFWHYERLVVIEDIPAIVCNDCHEQFFDDRSIAVIDLLRGDGFPPEKASRELRVPVFSFRDRLVPSG